jgi:uncharacterized protein (DUF58 family)
MTGTIPLWDFDPQFLRKLEHVALVSRHPVAGPSTGPRRSTRHGSSAEFADFREYAPGDDLRRVDWNAYARLDRLFLRLFTAEEIATLTIFLDHSGSMAFGDPSKALMAARLAAAFSYVALFGHDHVAVAGWSDAIREYLPPQTGTQSVPRVWRFIARLMAMPAGRTEFSSLRMGGPLRRGGGLALVISDFLSDSDWRAGILALRAGGQEVTVVQVLAPDELRPDLAGDWELRDVETDASIEVTGTSRLLREYGERLGRHLDALREFCRAHRVGYVLVSSDERLEDTLLQRLQSAGIVT